MSAEGEAQAPTESGERGKVSTSHDQHRGSELPFGQGSVLFTPGGFKRESIFTGM